MVVVAIAVKGHEYLYSAKTAHKVNAKKAGKIAELLNAAAFKIDAGHIWHTFEIDDYDAGFVWASEQEFRLGKRGLIRRGYAWPTL